MINFNQNEVSQILQRFWQRKEILQWTDYVNQSNKGFNVRQVPDLFNICKNDLIDLLKLLGLKLVIIENDQIIQYKNYELKMEKVVQDKLDIQIPLIITEIARYPNILWASLKLKNLILCNNAFIDGQLRYAVPNWGDSKDYQNNSLIISCSLNNTKYVIHIIHHEIFHFIDYNYNQNYPIDQEFQNLNQKGFQYGNGGVNNRIYNELKNDFLGFVSEYSKSAIEEDKAEIFASLMRTFDDTNNTVDVVLQEKIFKLILDLNNYNSQIFNETFWDSCRQYKDIIKLIFDI